VFGRHVAEKHPNEAELSAQSRPGK
jgi:hypothetical protein